MDIVRTVKEAENWFTTHHSGFVQAVNEEGVTKSFDNFPDTEYFLAPELNYDDQVHLESAEKEQHYNGN